MKKLARKIGNLISDNVDIWMGKRDPLTPPARKNFVGNGDFKEIGETFLKYFIELGDLKPRENVLDIGCGIGRMAVPLTGYLDKHASYDGFDIVKKGIDWTRANITKRYPNFHFQLAEVFNKNYNPKGRYGAEEFIFPYKDESFDFIILTSVFTHMLPPDVENYMSEISRTLKKGERCFATFFLLNEESLSLMGKPASRMNFVHDFKPYRTIDRDTPEAAVCYEEKFVLDIFSRNGLKIRMPIRYGSWCRRDVFLSFQDIVVAGKK